MSPFIKRTVVLVTMSHNSLVKLHNPHKASLSPKNWDNQIYISATSQMGLFIHRREWKKGMSSLTVDAHINIRTYTYTHIHKQVAETMFHSDKKELVVCI